MMAAKREGNRAQIMVPGGTRDLAAKLRDELVERTGGRITLSDIVHRALVCLDDTHNRGAWLSPKEAAPVLEERHRQKVASALAQFIARACPDRKLKGIAFDTESGMMTVMLDEGDPIGIWAGQTDQEPTKH